MFTTNTRFYKRLWRVCLKRNMVDIFEGCIREGAGKGQVALDEQLFPMIEGNLPQAIAIIIFIAYSNDKSN